jgi:two-component system chemotaxis response regulator CheY
MYTLLIADDSGIIRRNIENAIGQRTDIRIIGQATDGDEALRLFGELLPDVVSLDLVMPGLSGGKCVAPMLQLKPDSRILIVSALADKKTALAAIKQGASGFLGKPFSAEELNSALDELLTPL